MEQKKLPFVGRVAFFKGARSVREEQRSEGGEVMKEPVWLEKQKAFILDMDGTIYLGDQLFGYTRSFLQNLIDMGLEYYFFTNNSSKALSSYSEKLRRMNLPFQEDHLMNATQVMIQYLNKKGVQNIFTVGTQALQKELEAAGLIQSSNPELVVLGFDTELDYEKVRKACHWVRNGVPILGVNPDLNCPTEEGMIPDCGSIGALITASTGCKIEYIGKPHFATYDFVWKRTGLVQEEITWIGDRLYTDIAITQGTNSHSILVLSGESSEKDAENSKYHPDLIVTNLEELDQLLKKL